MFCSAFGWIFHIFLFLRVCAFLSFFFSASIMKVWLVFLLSPLTVTVNYIEEFKSILRDPYLISVWCLALKLSSYHFMGISGRSAYLDWYCLDKIFLCHFENTFCLYFPCSKISPRIINNLLLKVFCFLTPPFLKK